MLATGRRLGTAAFRRPPHYDRLAAGAAPGVAQFPFADFAVLGFVPGKEVVKSPQPAVVIGLQA